MKPHTSRVTAMLYLAVLQQQRNLGFAQRCVEIPKTARSGICFVHELRPFLAEANFVRPMTDRNERQKHGQGHQGKCPGRFSQHSGNNPKNVASDLGEAAVVTMNASATCAKAGEEFFDSADAGDFGVSKSDTGKCVRIA